MTRCSTSQRKLSRREFSIAVGLFALPWGLPLATQAAEAETLDARFEFLSNHGNSTCSAVFTELDFQDACYCAVAGLVLLAHGPAPLWRAGAGAHEIQRHSGNPARSL